MTHNFYFAKRYQLAAAIVLAAVAFGGCGDSTSPSRAPAAVAAETTPPAAATAGVPVTGPAVRVTDAGGGAVAGVDVSFDVTAGNGTVQYSTARTDENGVASAGAWQIGEPGTNTVTATVEGLAPVSFSTTADIGGASVMLKPSGDNQLGHPSAALPNPLTVKIVNAGGIGIPGQTVTFTVTSGGGSIAGASTVTDAFGFASSGTWTLGPSFGIHKVVAQSGSLQATFTAIADPCDDRTALAVGGSATGTLAFDPARCAKNGAAADRYSVATPAGAVQIDLTSAAFDALLNVWDASGSTLYASNDNAASGTTNSGLRLITAATTKTVDATSAAAGKTGSYTLTVTSTSADVSTCGTTYLEVGASTDQTLATTDCTTNYNPASSDWSKSTVAGDAFMVYIPSGTTVRISQTAQPLDALLTLYSPSGTLLQYRDNGGVGASGTEVITFTSTTSGFYKVVAGSYCLLFEDPYQAGCDYGAYNLSVVKQ